MRQVWNLWASTMLLALGGLVVVPAAAKELVAAEVNPPGHILVFSEEVLALRLSELTKGELDIQLKHSGQLGNENDYWDNIRNGSLDIARINLGVLGNEVPTAKLASLPYLFYSRDHMWQVLDGSFGQRIRAEVEKAGAVVLAYYDAGTRSFYTTEKQIRFKSDFAGLRIRVQNSPVYQDLITQLGGIPVVMDLEKVGNALKNGEIDGAENNLPDYMASGHYKYARYLSLDEHSSVPDVLVMAKKTWDGLSREQQKAVKTAAAESSANMKLLWTESENQALAKAKKQGVNILDKGELGMNGIESFSVKIVSKHVTNPEDLGQVLSILLER